MIYPKPYSIYLRGTIDFRVQGYSLTRISSSGIQGRRGGGFRSCSARSSNSIRVGERVVLMCEQISQHTALSRSPLLLPQPFARRLAVGDLSLIML